MIYMNQKITYTVYYCKMFQKLIWVGCSIIQLLEDRVNIYMCQFYKIMD